MWPCRRRLTCTSVDLLGEKDKEGVGEMKSHSQQSLNEMSASLIDCWSFEAVEILVLSDWVALYFDRKHDKKNALTLRSRRSPSRRGACVPSLETNNLRFHYKRTHDRSCTESSSEQMPMAHYYSHGWHRKALSHSCVLLQHAAVSGNNSADDVTVCRNTATNQDLLLPLRSREPTSREGRFYLAPNVEKCV